MTRTKRWLAAAVAASSLVVVRTAAGMAVGEDRGGGYRGMAVRAEGKVVRISEGSALELRDGRLLMIYQEFEKGEGDSDFFPGRLVSRVSSDGGRTWGLHRVLVEPGAADINVYSPSLLRLADGSILFCFMRYHRAPSTATSPPATAFAWRSTDEGRTFQPLGELWRSLPYALCSDTLRLLKSGRLLIPVCRDTGVLGKGDHWESGVSYSDDGGKSWAFGKGWVDLPRRGAMEPHAEELADGRLWMVFRTQLGKVFRAESRDGGGSWAAAVPMPQESPESCPNLIRLPASRELLLIWNAARYDPGWASHFGKRTPLSVAISSDDGKSWSLPRQLETDPGKAFTNPGVAFTSAGTAVFNYWSCDYEPSGRMQNYPIHLRTAVVPLEWLRGAKSPPPDYAEHADLTYRLNEAGERLSVRERSDWELRRSQIADHFRRVAGGFPWEGRASELDVRVEDEVREKEFVRRRVSFVSEPGDRVGAYLFLPRRRSGRRPAILCLQQTTQMGAKEPSGLAGSPSMHYGLELARRGFVVLAPDYPTFGEHRWRFTPDNGYASGTMKAVWDNRRAVDLLAALPEVDARRIGCIGHSLGGHNAIFTALFEPRLRAIVSSCGFSSFVKDDVPSWTGPRYMPRIAALFGSDPRQVPFDFTELVAAIAPRPFLACAATRDNDFDVSGVKDVLQSARMVYRLYGAERKLQGFYPDSPHDFPEDARLRAYRFLETHLK